jgi:hypothetical protein
MENNQSVKLVTIVSMLVIVFLGLFLSFYIYSFLTSSLITGNVEKKPIKIDNELYKTLTDIPNFGSSVTAEEPGYGRDNPFASYKELASEAAEATVTTPATTVPTAP